MRSAAEIVGGFVREVSGSTETLDQLERRTHEFGLVSVKAPERSLERVVAGAVAGELRKLHTSLSVTRFAL